jgi:DNA-directed RNA polymerase subunit omega
LRHSGPARAGCGGRKGPLLSNAARPILRSGRAATIGQKLGIRQGPLDPAPLPYLLYPSILPAVAHDTGGVVPCRQLSRPVPYLEVSDKPMIESLKSDEITWKAGGRFKLCTLVQRRLVELMDGARPLVERRGRSDLEIAIEEVMQEKIAVRYVDPESLPAASDDDALL